MELELVVLVFASFRAYRILTILAFESKSSSLFRTIGRGAHYPPGAGCGVVKGILIVWHACSFLASSILFKLLNVFHTDSVLLRN